MSRRASSAGSARPASAWAARLCRPRGPRTRPLTGLAKRHAAEQAALIAEALGHGGKGDTPKALY